MFKKENKESNKKENSKLRTCKICGNEVASSTKRCIHCGARIKKSIFKKIWFWIIVLFLILLVGIAGGGGNSSGNEEINGENTVEEQKTQSSQEKLSPELEGIELKTDLEKQIWEIIYNNNSELWSIETFDDEETGGVALTIGVGVENDENIVNKLLSEMSELVTKGDTVENLIIIFGDIDDGEDGDMLLMAGVYDDGRIETSMESSDYNSERNRWIRNQFSAWDGAHIVLEELIIDNLNNEDSYEHIETTYREVSSEEIASEINEILTGAGYSQRVKVGDLFISCEFSAENGFGAIIKNTAIGISSYTDDMVYLVDIG